MFHKGSSWQYKLARRSTPFLMGALALLLVSTSASAAASCRRVHGVYEEHAADPSSCPSPVGLCIEGEFSGTIKGAFASTATALQPNADTPATAVVWFTGSGVTHAKVRGKQGDILFKSSGAFQTTGEGNIVDVQVITGGTGELTGITGVIRASGQFDPVAGIGESEYEGTICLP